MDQRTTSAVARTTKRLPKSHFKAERWKMMQWSAEDIDNAAKRKSK